VNFNGQQIGRIFTFLAGLIILVHAIVPHHHHFEASHVIEQEASCETTHQEESEETQDFHCHAFNVLASEKTTNSSLNKFFPDYFSFFLSGILVNIDHPSAHYVITPDFGYTAIIIEQFFYTPTSLRGPPLYA
jgi:hypothetical protein